MNDFQFEEGGQLSWTAKAPEADSFLVRIAKKCGARTDSQVQIILLGVAGVFIVLTIIIVASQIRGNNPPPLPPLPDETIVNPYI